MPSSLRGCFWLMLLVGLFGPAVQAQQNPPRFRASVEVTSVDVTVIDGRGRPILGLTPEDFTVRVDGAARRVVSAEWVPLSPPEGASALPPPPEGYSTNESATGGRLIVIVVDQPNIRFGGTVGIRNAVNGFIDRLQPVDRVAAVGVGPGSRSTEFTADRERVKQAIAGMVGQRISVGTDRHNIAVSEALAIQRGDPLAFEMVVSRECARERPGTPGFAMCVAGVQNDAEAMAVSGIVDGEQTINTLRDLLIGLQIVDAPKTLVLVSEGFVMNDQQSSLIELGHLAAAARTSIYALQLNDQVFDIAQRQPPGSETSRFEDRSLRSEGLGVLTSAARGSLFTINVAADAAFERIESELSGYYLLGVEAEAGDRDGRSRSIRVDVARSGVTVRARRQLLSGSIVSRPRTAREAVMTGLKSPLMLSALSLRVATFSLQGPEPSKVQMLIHADVGANYSSGKVVSLGYMIIDGSGRIVESLAANARLQPVLNGVPSPLQFTGGASLSPGEYTLKLAVAEGDRVGTIEHTVRARLVNAGSVNLSELMVGGPVDPSPALRPTVGHTVSYGIVHGYVEGYGPGVGELTGKYEIAAEPDGPAILAADVDARSAGDERAIFTQVLPVRQLPPGKYVLRATISSSAGPVKTMARTFEVAPPAVLMTSAETTAGTFAVAPTEVFLPVTDQAFARAFERAEAIRADTVQAFRARVGSDAVNAFDRGVSLLAAGDYQKAEASFKAAVQIDGDSTAALAYLAAAFAASGHDREAAGAWQTSLIAGDDMPQIYLWLGDALLRSRELAQARTILEEAIAKWPADVRFAKPLAMLYATFGQGREAVRTLERHLGAHPDDRDALYMGIEWIYHLHASGAVAHTKAEDLKRARSYAEAYEKASGPQLALVKQWMGFLERP